MHLSAPMLRRVLFGIFGLALLLTGCSTAPDETSAADPATGSTTSAAAANPARCAAHGRGEIKPCPAPYDSSEYDGKFIVGAIEPSTGRFVNPTLTHEASYVWNDALRVQTYATYDTTNPDPYAGADEAQEKADADTCTKAGLERTTSSFTSSLDTLRKSGPATSVTAQLSCVSDDNTVWLLLRNKGTGEITDVEDAPIHTANGRQDGVSISYNKLRYDTYSNNAPGAYELMLVSVTKGRYERMLNLHKKYDESQLPAHHVYGRIDLTLAG